ncbi:MAG: DNA polymerase III subunit gamma/tau [Sphingomonadales bacterium]|nr:DNA polymerase III subunit gamma/tau [Sphingomonadales bacterium]PIX65097.1 MAG: DNA polymerase III subunit gamma/tau [Sphingomonadales bacterium CG_4_10_14_3_um_filter_58_15]NCO48057.1 DNA polymerase III subunit gamma/tau [Sphingomonadales bacterium]NCO99627.1 DNA polymerase III subunit gamma/tau [Sphingomonadales bacterium]NCP27190.1 DNA polymerase III subunit gamma/tau [Sphingomonadales bacterium]
MSDSHDIFAATGVDAPTQPAPGAAQPYRVLARKYRPSKFSELIGQDAMVQTLGNAIKRDRLAHAFLMTGVRGVGKTSTARLIAKALNCIGEDGQGGPTIDPCGVCEPCRSIAEGSFIDVIEMDAASHTGVDDVREIIEAVRYSSVSARYKIYIIDEVHMLSKNAFNALLKTLEEPPPHVKFIFATTEVHKVPITVLSRCQRFDLKRISADQLSEHFGMIVGKEGVTAEQEALDLIAQAAEGSVRDGLSILDQAIAHADMDGDGQVKAAQIRDMLGLSDRGAVRRLFGKLLEGDSAALLDAIAEQYKIGVEPLSLMNGLLSLSHQVTLFKVGKASDPTLSEDARQQLSDWSGQLSYPVLHRLWQLLLKGYQEVQQAHLPREACEMALLRVLCAADMPDPGKLAKMLEQGVPPSASPTDTPRAPQSAHEPVAQAAPAPVAAPEPQTSGLPKQFAEAVKAVGRVSAVLESILMADMRVVSFEAPDIVYQPARPIAVADIRKIADALKQETGIEWTIAEGPGEAKPSLVEQEQQARDAERQAILDAPLVKAAFEAFPDAQLLENDDPRPQESRSA